MDPMGNVIDGRGALPDSIDEWWATLDQEEPAIIAREPVKDMIHTGFKHLE
jgi:flagellar biosynthesis/type III secretory pathway ATPase